MASVIQSVIQKYKPTVEKQNEWALTSDEQKMASLRLERLAQAFMGVIVLSVCSEERLATISERAIQKNANDLLDLASQNRNIGFGSMKQVIGKFIFDEFATNASLNGLQEEFYLLYEEADDDFNTLTEPDSMCIDEEEEDFQSFLKFIHSDPKNKDKPEFNQLPEIKKQLDWESNPHVNKVMSYLIDISAPQTQLTYLCQAMGWKLNFLDKFADDSQFQMIVAVDFNFKKVKKTLIETYVAKQKKLGKTVAAFKMLRKIYLSFPEIWDLYEEKRTKKALVIEKNPMNPLKFVPLEILNEKVQPIETKFERDQSFLKDKDNYLKSIASFKSELNLLNQQNPGLFTIKMDKVKIEGTNQWKVTGELIIKFKGNEEFFQIVEQNINSKGAEEVIAKKMVSIIYDNYIDIFQKMVLIKNKKSIKT